MGYDHLGTKFYLLILIVTYAIIVLAVVAISPLIVLFALGRKLSLLVKQLGQSFQHDWAEPSGN